MKKTIKRTLRVSKYVIYKETLVDYKEHFWSFLGAFFGIGIIAFIQSHSLTETENIFLISSWCIQRSYLRSHPKSTGTTQKSGGRPCTFGTRRGYGLSVYSGYYLALCPTGCCFFYCSDAIYQDFAPTGRRYCPDCSKLYRKDSGIGILVRYLPSAFGVYYPVACGIIFQ